MNSRILFSLKFLSVACIAFGQLDSTWVERNAGILENLNHELNLDQAQQDGAIQILNSRAIAFQPVMSLEISEDDKWIQLYNLNKNFREQFIELLTEEQMDVFLSLRREKDEQFRVRNISRVPINEMPDEF